MNLINEKFRILDREYVVFTLILDSMLFRKTQVFLLLAFTCCVKFFLFFLI